MPDECDIVWNSSTSLNESQVIYMSDVEICLRMIVVTSTSLHERSLAFVIHKYFYFMDQLRWYKWYNHILSIRFVI